jgi:hypothetical protein
MQEADLIRSRGLRELLIAAAALAVVLAYLLRASLFGGEILSQADALYQFAPWSDVAPKGYEPSNALLLDQSIVMQPWLHFAGERLQEGQLPIWNPNNYAGQPMVGTYQSAYFWPLNWVYFAAPSWHFFSWSALLRLWAAGMFTFLFLRAIGVRAGASLVGALGFALSGFMVAWLGHMHTHVALFLPAFLWATERLAKSPTMRRTAVLGLLIGGALLAGHLQTAVHLAGALILYTLFRARFSVQGYKLNMRGVTLVGAAGLLGITLAMPQLLPFFDYLGTSQGAEVLEQMEVVAEVDVAEAAGLLVAPGSIGSPARAQGYGDYTGSLGANLNYSELIGGYVGRVLLLLAVLQLVWLRGCRPALFFGALAVLSALVAWQVFPFYDVAHAIPKLRSTKLMRVLVLTGFSLAVLGAIGLDGLAKKLRFEGAKANALFAFVFLVVASELTSFASGYNPSVSSEHIAPATPVTDFLIEHKDEGRILGVDNTILMPSANLFYDLPMLSGYDSMESRTMTELVALMSSDENGEYFIKEIGYFDQGYAIGNLLGVRYLLSAVPLPAPYELVLDGPTKIYSNPSAMPRAFLAMNTRVIADREERLAYLGSPNFDPRTAVLEEPLEGQGDQALGGGTANIITARDTHIEVECELDAPGLLVLADTFDKGWKATVDGKPATIHRADHTLRAVSIPKGMHTVIFGYEPPSLFIGLFFGALGLVALLGMLLLRESDPQDRQVQGVR